MTPWVVGIVCVLANVAAILSFVAGRRSDKPRRYAARAALCALATIATAVIGYVAGMAGAFRAVASADPSAKAALLAQAISEAMNLAVFSLLATLLPAGVAVFLLIAPPARPTSA